MAGNGIALIGAASTVLSSCSVKNNEVVVFSVRFRRCFQWIPWRRHFWNSETTGWLGGRQSDGAISASALEFYHRPLEETRGRRGCSSRCKSRRSDHEDVAEAPVLSRERLLDGG